MKPMTTELKTAAISFLATRRAHTATGNRDGEESASFLSLTLRGMGWRVPSHPGRFAAYMEAHGFSVRSHWAGRNLRTFISAPEPGPANPGFCCAICGAGFDFGCRCD